MGSEFCEKVTKKVNIDMNKKILFIGGSVNQTSQMHKISKFFDGDDCYFSPYYGSGYIDFFASRGVLNFSILGGKFQRDTVDYLKDHALNFDYKGLKHNYDLVFTGSDLIVPNNIKNKKLILVQEGMTDPENFAYYLVKYLGLPRYIASTATNGMSDLYDKFCVASEGYKEHFIRKGAKKEKMVVTGIPNFDNCSEFLNNDLPHKDYVLVATSDSRETFKYENRMKFLAEVKEMTSGKKVIFKLHPNEKVERATAEIKSLFPESIVYAKANTNHLIANCNTLITQYSSVVYVGMALGKEVHSYFDLNELRRMTPIQNGGESAANIARVGKELLGQPAAIGSVKHPQLSYGS